MEYVVLLRGINVGGKNRVPMAELKVLLENAGHTNVRTYINSGNVLLSSTSGFEKQLQNSIEKLLEANFGFFVKTLVKSRENFVKIVKSIPKKYTNDPAMKCDVLFLWDTYTSADVVAALPIRQGVDLVHATEGAIVWAVARKDINRSGLTKIIGTDFYAHITIRNCNTTRKLLLLLENNRTAS